MDTDRNRQKEEELEAIEESQLDSERGQWSNRVEFLLSCIGLSVGLGNVWRFPVLAYENGGAAFLIPYIVLQLLVGKPMYFMELAMGQYSNLGPTGVWRMNPMAKGIGVSMALISLIVSIYYNVVMAYTLYYFFASMQENLPWTTCPDAWLSRNCIVRSGIDTKISSGLLPCQYSDPFATGAKFCICNDQNMTLNYNMTENCYFGFKNMSEMVMYDQTKHNISVAVTINDTQYINETREVVDTNCSNWCVKRSQTRTAADIYFYDEVIKLSDGIHNLGSPIWYLALCLLLSWIVVVLCLIKGIKSSGKVVYFTATFPYVILLVLLVRGATLDGAREGVLYFLIPEWSKLLNLDVWKNAASQMFFSLGVSFGGIIMFGSYNKFRNNVYIDSLIISVMDILTSFIAGFVIFTTLGAMSKELNIPITEVAKKGYGLAFVAYPEALSRLPIPHLWSLLFFFMLFTLGLDSEFGLLETVLTCLQDEFPKLRRFKWLLCIGVGAGCYLLALPCITNGGDYVVTLMDSYGASFSLLFVSTAEVIAVMWVYGVGRFMGDVKFMIGYSPRLWPYWMFCWFIAAPVLVALLLLYTVIKYTPPSYSNDVPFSVLSQVLGWILAAVVMLPVPIWAFVALSRNGFCIFGAVKPDVTWGPACGIGKVDSTRLREIRDAGTDNVVFDKF